MNGHSGKQIRRVGRVGGTMTAQMETAAASFMWTFALHSFHICEIWIEMVIVHPQ